MANTILTPTVILKESLAVLHQKLNFIGNIVTDYDDKFAKKGAKIGNTISIRQPNQFTTRSGATLSAQDVTESSIDLTVDTQKGIDWSFDSEELTMHIDDFKERYIEPAMAQLAATMESDALSMYKDVYQFYDGVGSANSFNNISEGCVLLDEALAPLSGRCVVQPPRSVADVIQDTKGLYNDSSAVGKQYKEGALGRVGGFDHFSNTLVPSHTTGTAVENDTLYNINGAAESGATLTVDTGTTTLLKGDIITIAGVFRVHPESKVSTGILQQFVLTADSGATATSIAISPALTATGAKQNVSNVPADNSAINKVGGGASSTWQQALAFQKGAFAFGTADMMLPDGVDFAARENMDGISMRIIRDYTIADDHFPTRIDVLYGYKTIRPELAARIGFRT